MSRTRTRSARRSCDLSLLPVYYAQLVTAEIGYEPLFACSVVEASVRVRRVLPRLVRAGLEVTQADEVELFVRAGVYGSAL